MSCTAQYIGIEQSSIWASLGYMMATTNLYSLSFHFQTSTNVLLIMEAVIISVSTNQDHSSVNAKKDINWISMAKNA